MAEGKPIDHIASVASFFVSRVDSNVDKQLEAIVDEGGTQAAEAESLLGRAAVANAKLAYADFQRVFCSDRFATLHAKARGCSGRCGHPPARRTRPIGM